jgi:DNA-binding LytR/AlgR family response regulator
MTLPPATALIAEDEPLLAQALQAELARLWPQLRISACVGDGAAAVDTALRVQPDVCFLDIRMPGLSGLEAAQALAEDWPDTQPFPLIVFVTAYDQYAMQAFDAQAVDYVLKPVQPERLARSCARVAQMLSDRRGKAGDDGPDEALARTLAQLQGLLQGQPAAPTEAPLTVLQASVGNTIHMVNIDEVVYFEAADKYVRVITADKEHLIRLSLKELLPQLDPQRFWQVHRGTIVQARCIAQARREESGKVTLMLRDRPETLTASRLYAHLFKGM